MISAKDETGNGLVLDSVRPGGVLVGFVFTNLVTLCKLAGLCQDITMEGASSFNRFAIHSTSLSAPQSPGRTSVHFRQSEMPVNRNQAALFRKRKDFPVFAGRLFHFHTFMFSRAHRRLRVPRIISASSALFQPAAHFKAHFDVSVSRAKCETQRHGRLRRDRKVCRENGA